MKLLRRLLGVIVLPLATIVFICCIGGIVGTWKAQQEATQKVEQVSAQLDDGLKRASDVTDNILKALRKADKEVSQVNKEASDLGNGPVKNRLMADLLRKSFQEKLGPNLNEMRGRLDTFVDVSVALSSLLRSTEELPGGRPASLSQEKLDRAADQAAQASVVLLKLQATLGQGNQSASEEEVVTAAKQVEQVLGNCEAVVKGVRSDLGNAKTELSQFKTRVLSWLLLGAVILTILCAWVAISQISLFAHAWKWLWGA